MLRPIHWKELSVTTVSLRFPPLGQIHMAFGNMDLTRGSGTHRLVLPVAITCTWLDPDVPTSTSAALLVGTVWTTQPNLRWLAGLEPQVLNLRGFAIGEKLALSLSDEQLIALERARGEGDIVLKLELQATLLTPYEDVHPITATQTEFYISSSRWFELLDQVGSEVGILVRIPSPLTDSPTEPPPTASADNAASLAQATARLRDARAELRNHQWEHCVATCRKVLENINLLVSLPSAKDLFKVNTEKRSQDERWAAIYYDVKCMASAAHHDGGTTEDFIWRRADAEAVLAATAGLLLLYTAK